MEISITEALCIFNSGWKTQIEKELYDKSYNIIREESRRLYLIYQKQSIDKKLEQIKKEKGILDNLNSKQLDELEVILKKNRILYNEEEAENLLTHFAVEIQRQNKIGQIPIDIIGWFERNKEKFKNK